MRRVASPQSEMSISEAPAHGPALGAQLPCGAPGNKEITAIDDAAVEKYRREERRLPLVVENLLTTHLHMTTPQLEVLFLPLEGQHFREDSCELFEDLKPRNAIEAMIAAHAVGVFNASLALIAEGMTRETPFKVRHSAIRHGFNGASVNVGLLKTLHHMQKGPDANVTVGSVNVKAGGQAIVGHVETTKKVRRRPRRRGRSSPNEV